VNCGNAFPEKYNFRSASRRASALSGCFSANRITAFGSTEEYCRSAQPIAF